MFSKTEASECLLNELGVALVSHPKQKTENRKPKELSQQEMKKLKDSNRWQGEEESRGVSTVCFSQTRGEPVKCEQPVRANREVSETRCNRAEINRT